MTQLLHRTKRFGRRTSLLLALAVMAGGIGLAGCKSATDECPCCKSGEATAQPSTTQPANSQPAKPTTQASDAIRAFGPPTVSAGGSMSRPATSAPAAPPTPDPREAAYLNNVTQLTFGFDRAGEGYFSKDGKWIVFQATPPGEKEYQMYVAPLDLGDGTKPKIGTPVRVSPTNSRNTCGYFSPDGSTLIFGSTAGKEKPEDPSAGYQRQGGNYRWAFPDGMEIYAAKDWKQAVGQDSDWTLVTPNSVTTLKLADLATPANRLTNNEGYDAEASYSPDGKWLCFTSRRSGDTEVWVMKADGTNAVQITNSKNYDGGPFFAPDGKRLIYRSDRKGNDLLQVYVADLAFDDKGDITGMKAERQLTDDANVNWGPIFHPDNQHIVYATSQHGHHNYEVYWMKDDGSEKTRITYCAGFDGLPVFSADGKYLMWTAKRSANNTSQLFIGQFEKPVSK